MFIPGTKGCFRMGITPSLNGDDYVNYSSRCHLFETRWTSVRNKSTRESTALVLAGHLSCILSTWELTERHDTNVLASIPRMDLAKRDYSISGSQQERWHYFFPPCPAHSLFNRAFAVISRVIILRIRLHSCPQVTIATDALEIILLR